MAAPSGDFNTAEEEPQSVEEAGALLGAAINFYDAPGTSTTINPPKGTHSSFSILSPVPSSDLMARLHSLRSLLRSAPRDTPLVAAPSLLAGVLMKLLGISSNLASAGGSGDPTRRTATPPMLSTPLRKLWVDCVVLCHALGEGLSGNSRINIFGFVRNMIQLAAINPRSARAAGGTRLAALEVIAGLMKEESLAKQLSSWALDVIQLCQRSLKSSGNGESSYRIAAVETASAAAIASRIAFIKLRPGIDPLVLKGALEDKAIIETVRLLKIAIADKYPEVRQGAARLASLVAPLVIHTSFKSPRTPDAVALSATSALEDIMTIAMKNLDDESPAVGGAWAEALARCMCTSIAYHTMLNAEKTSNRNIEGDGSPAAVDGPGGGRGVRKGVLAASLCSTLPKAMQYLVNMFVKVGGELTVPRTGGNFSVGGRAMRNGLGRTLVSLLRVQSSLQTIGEGKSISYKEAISLILSMVGNAMESQLVGSRPGQSTGNNLFGQGPKISSADAGLARLAAARVLREGISELSTESTQLSILHELIHLCDNQNQSLNGSQLQVVLIEISHLLAVLGEATTSAQEDLSPALEKCLRHSDQGVRHEAAIACAAMTSVFPSLGRKLVEESINSMQLEHAELMALASTKSAEEKTETPVAGRFARFRRQPSPVKESKVDDSGKHKHAIHGMSLMVAIIVQDLPSLPGGLPIQLLGKAVSVAEILVNTLFNEIMTSGNPGGVCTCVRGGFGILCGVLATGTSGVEKHISQIFGLWQKVVKEGQRGGKFKEVHELVCVEAMLQSAVAFLRHCSEFLLSLPDALSKISLVLEETLPSLYTDGRFGKVQSIPAAASQFNGAKAAIFEAFAWLPPGSYPMVADDVFAFAALHIQSAIEKDVTCSILSSLVSKEDALLDTTTFSRATRPGQVGGSTDLENDIVTLRSEPAFHNDRESALHLLLARDYSSPRRQGAEFLESQVLGMLLAEEKPEKAPTPLHEVGTWRRPVNPSCSSKVRLVDAAIEAFVATFALKSGKEQQGALQMLESLLPPAHLQASRSSDHNRRGKTRDDCAATANIAAVLLSCLKALPIFESTHNVPVNLGPVWMNKAKDVFLNLLRSPSHEVRRAAAEGLGFLSTLGVREDARFLQSAVLHSLDEVIQGSQNQDQGKPLSLEAISAGRSAALLALACMQRTAYRIKQQRETKALERGGSMDQDDLEEEEGLPLFQTLIKILPSITIRPTGGFLGVRAIGLHSFGLLFSYSKRLEETELGPQDIHLLKKMVNLIEDNFLAAWTAASNDYDHGTDAEKLASEASFIAVLFRLMTFVTPFLFQLQESDVGVARRFSRMATIMIDCFGSHPVVELEAIAFYEVLSQHQQLLPSHIGGVKYEEHPILVCIPMLLQNLEPERPAVHHSEYAGRPAFGMSSPRSLRAALRLIEALSSTDVLVAEWSDMKIVSILYASLEFFVGTQIYAGNTFHRGLAAPRESEQVYKSDNPTADEISTVMQLLVTLERLSKTCMVTLLRYILMSRCVLMGLSSTRDDEDDEDTSFTVSRVVATAEDRAVSDISSFFDHSNQARWQVKALAVHTMTIALVECCKKNDEVGLPNISSALFNPKVADAECRASCRKAMAEGAALPSSILSLHLNAIVTAACVTATATVDQAELRCLQESAMHLLSKLIASYGDIPDHEQPDMTLLSDFIPQISSAMKNALGAPSEEDGAPACRLFFIGCETLQQFLKKGVTNDRAVLKRVVRPILPILDETPFFELSERVPESVLATTTGDQAMNGRANVLVPTGKMWTLGTLLQGSDLLSMIEARDDGLGAHAAALAMDGANILLSSGITLVGWQRETINLETHQAHTYYFSNPSDIDDSARAGLSRTWASIAATSVNYLCKAAPTSSDRNQVEAWLSRIVPFLFAGLEDALAEITETRSVPLNVGWAMGINGNDITCSCLQGITTLVSNEDMLSIDETWVSKIEKILAQISSTILEPMASGKGNEGNLKINMEVLKASCSLLLSLVRNDQLTDKSTTLMSILGPIRLLESGDADLCNKEAGLVISACLTAVASMISKPSTPPTLAKAMVTLVTKVASEEKEITSTVKASIRVLLQQCLSHEAITAKDQSDIAVSMAKQKDWETWSVVVSAKEGIAAKASLEVMRDILLDCGDCSQQVVVLAALRTLLQRFPSPNDCTGRIVCSIGAETLAIFEAYGTLNVPGDAKSHRTAVCADAMKIALVMIQQFGADGTGAEDVANFLVVLFKSLIAVLRFNGLPNHPSPQPGSSDPAVGKMCAQAITYVARTTPVPFKSCMTLMSEHDRTVLEFAVRADMSGYVNASAQAPTKKKLSLKGFKK